MASIPHSDPKLPFRTNRCKCSSCGEYFGGVRAFEKHRTGPATDRACLPPSCVSDRQKRPLLRLNSHGYWVHIEISINAHNSAAKVAA